MVSAAGCFRGPVMSTTAPLLEVENLQAQFATAGGTVKAVDGISFTLAKGETVGLVGESGSGNRSRRCRSCA